MFWNNNNYYLPSVDAWVRNFSERKTNFSVSSRAFHRRAILDSPVSTVTNFNSKQAALNPSVTMGTWKF